MKSFAKAFSYFFSFLVFTGILSPSCDDGLNCNFKDVPDFFDTEFISVGNSENFVSIENGTALWEDYQIYVFMGGRLYGESRKKPSPSFSLLSKSYACSPPIPGSQGTEEAIEQLYFITLNDYDAAHLAMDTINEYIVPQEGQYGEDFRTIDSLLIFYPDRWPYREFFYTLNTPPSLDSTLHIAVHIYLDNGEYYQAENEPILLRIE